METFDHKMVGVHTFWHGENTSGNSHKYYRVYVIAELAPANGAVQYVVRRQYGRMRKSNHNGGGVVNATMPMNALWMAQDKMDAIILQKLGRGYVGREATTVELKFINVMWGNTALPTPMAGWWTVIGAEADTWLAKGKPGWDEFYGKAFVTMNAPPPWSAAAPKANTAMPKATATHEEAKRATVFVTWRLDFHD